MARPRNLFSILLVCVCFSLIAYAVDSPGKPSGAADGASATAGADSGTVYATASGTKYHREGCQYLSKSKIPMTLSDASAKGLTPCSICKPTAVAATPTAPSVAAKPAPNVPQETKSAPDTVFGTKTGAKFHRDGCQYLSKSKIPMTLKEATERGLTACSVCRPVTVKGNEVYTGSHVVPPAEAPKTSASPEAPALSGKSSGLKASAQAKTDAGAEDTTVYVTNSGRKYHTAGCRYLKSSRPISKSQAQASGYAPCSACGGG